MRDNFELINHAQSTPQRLHALVRLVKRLDAPTRQEILDYLQPNSISDNQDAAIDTFNSALRCRLIAVKNNPQECVQLHPDIPTDAASESVEWFRTLMQQRLLNVIDPDEDNYLLNLFTAWYAVQDHLLLNKRPADIQIQFNQEMYPQEDDSSIETGRAFSPRKLTTWRTWAAFLGWGWVYEGRLMPSAHVRLRPILKTINNKELPFAQFMRVLAQACPELDRGLLFEQCRRVSRPAENHGQRLSLILSTALRVLHEEGEITLVRQADVPDLWHLFPAEGQITEVSHIEIRG